jgi:hypothetical protein
VAAAVRDRLGCGSIAEPLSRAVDDLFAAAAEVDRLELSTDLASRAPEEE